MVHGQTYTRAGSQQSEQKTNSIHVAVIVHMCNEVPRIKAVSPASSMANVQVLFDNQTSTSKSATINESIAGADASVEVPKLHN